jgi:hypothetical protein
LVKIKFNIRSREVSEHAKKICAPKSILKCFNRIKQSLCRDHPTVAKIRKTIGG